MIIYLFALILFNIFDGFQMILLEKTKYIKPSKDSGPAKYDFYFRAIDSLFDSDNINMYEGCDYGRLYSNVQCDLTISNHAWCLTKLKPKENLPPQYYNLFSSFYKDKSRSYCKFFKTITIKSNENLMYKRIYLGSHFYNYAFVNFYFGDFEDYNSGVQWKSIKTVLRPKVSVKENVFTQLRYIKMLKVYAMTEIAVKVKCKNFYHGLSCWYYCKSSSIKKCNCTEKAKFTDQPCIKTCDPMFVETYNLLKVAETIYKFRTCTTINYCKSSEGKKCKHQCFVISNNTGICTELKLSVTSNIQPANITSNYVFNNERITVKPDEGKHNKLFNQIKYNLQNKILIDINFINDIKNDKELQFTINFKGLSDQYYNIRFSFYLSIWKKRYYRNLLIQIFVRPSNVAIFKSDHTPLGVNVESGSYYFCNASIYPPYFSLLFLSLRDFEVKPLPIRHGQIPYDRNIIYGKIACNVSLIVPGRGSFHLATSQNIHVKYKKDIAIEPVTDIFEKTNNIKCVPKSKYEDVFFYQFDGETELKFDELVLNLANAYDGLYKVGCSVIIRGLIRSTVKEFSVRLKMTEVCFFVFAFVKGAIVQCGHNGLIPDEYRVIVKLTVPDKDEFNITNERFAQIPYNLDHKTYIGECFVSNVFDPNVNMTKKITIEIKNDVMGTYAVEKSHKNCAANLQSMDRLSIKFLFRHSITLNHLLFDVKFNIPDYSGDTLFIYLLLLILLSHIFLSYIYILLSQKEFSWMKTVDQYLRFNKLRSMHEILHRKAHDMITINTVARNNQSLKDSNHLSINIDANKFYFLTPNNFKEEKASLVI